MPCNGSKTQQWSLKALKSRAGLQGGSEANTEAGGGGSQIISANGMCIGEATSPAASATVSVSASASLASALVFDVGASLGWKHGAKVRDLGRHKELGVMSTVSVQLQGDGDSKIFKLTPA